MSPVSLKSIISFSRDGEWGKGEPFEGSIKMRVIRGTDFEKIRAGQLQDIPIRYISSRFADYKTLKPNDIILETAGGSKNRPTGRTVFIKPSLIRRSDLPLICASFARFLRIDQNKAIPRYVFWHLQYLYEAGYLLKYHTQHTGVSRFQYTIFAENEPLRLAPIDVQQKIAAVLSAYDDLIENNTRRIAILEEMAQLIYREWFVHFRFPGHEEVEMVEVEGHGLVPVGWRIIPVTEAVDFNPKMRTPSKLQKPYLLMDGLSTQSMIIDTSGLKSKKGNSGSKFRNYDTLLARITPSLENGKTGFVQFLPADDAIALGSTEFIVMRAKLLPPYYVYLLARDERFRANAIKSMIGASGRQRVQMSCFDTFFIALPDSSTLQRFTEIISPIFDLIWVLSRQCHTLRRTRDVMLPRLISGELDVGELDIITSE
jgi:type I restriction enzyme S subunit